jgi:hypothetical protein
MRHDSDFGQEKALVGGDLVRAEAWDALGPADAFLVCVFDS